MVLLAFIPVPLAYGDRIAVDQFGDPNLVFFCPLGFLCELLAENFNLRGSLAEAPLDVLFLDGIPLHLRSFDNKLFSA